MCAGYQLLWISLNFQLRHRASYVHVLWGLGQSNVNHLCLISEQVLMTRKAYLLIAANDVSGSELEGIIQFD
jgi:hypothetical protein